MFRLSKLADYGILLLVAMERRGSERTWSAREAAEAVGLPAPSVSKVFKLLARDGLLSSQRGAAGGYRLAFPAEMITVSQIITSLDGPIAITECAEVTDCACEQEPSCITRPNWLLINEALRDALGRITLHDMAKDMGESKPSLPTPVEAVPRASRGSDEHEDSQA